MQSFKNTYNKLIYCFIILIIFIILTFAIKSYFKPFFMILVITFICKPIYDLLCSIRVFNKNINAVISILLINVVFFFIAFYTGKILFYKLYSLVLNNYSQILYDLDNISYKLNELAGYNVFKFNSDIKNFYVNILNNGYLKKGAIYTTNGIVAYFISNIAVYFILVDKSGIVNIIKDLFPESKISIINDKFNELNKVFKIEIILVLITTLETLGGFILLGVNNCVFLSALCGILDLVPYIGTILVFVPLILYNFIIRKNVVAIGLIILYILLQVTRQILEAKLVSKRLDIHPLVIIMSLYIGVKVFGVIGLIMAPLYIIVTKEVVLNE